VVLRLFPGKSRDARKQLLLEQRCLGPDLPQLVAREVSRANDGAALQGIESGAVLERSIQVYPGSNVEDRTEAGAVVVAMASDAGAPRIIRRNAINLVGVSRGVGRVSHEQRH